MMITDIPTRFLMVATLAFGLPSCQKEHEINRVDQEATSPSEPGRVTAPKDAGTGNAEAKGVQSGSGTRSDYKPTTGPGGIEESKKAPEPAR